MVVDLVAVGFPVVVCRTRSDRYESLYIVANNRQSRCWMARLFDRGSIICRFSRRKGFFILLAVTPWLIAFLLSFVVWGKEQQEVRVALVQANLKQDRKWLVEERSRNLEKHLALSDENWGYDLIVWPEAAITLFGIEAQRALELLDQKALQANTNFISGIPTLDPVDGTNKNSLVAIGQGKGIYSKHILSPLENTCLLRVFCVV